MKIGNYIPLEVRLMHVYTYISLLFAIWLVNVGFIGKHPESRQANHRFQNFSVREVKQIDDEYLDWRSMRINGELPLLTSWDSLIHFVGKADSTVAPDDVCVSFYDKPFEYVYFDGIKVELYGDTAVITSLNFNVNHQLSQERIR